MCVGLTCLPNYKLAEVNQGKPEPASGPLVSFSCRKRRRRQRKKNGSHTLIYLCKKLKCLSTPAPTQDLKRPIYTRPVAKRPGRRGPCAREHESGRSSQRRTEAGPGLFTARRWMQWQPSPDLSPRVRQTKIAGRAGATSGDGPETGVVHASHLGQRSQRR